MYCVLSSFSVLKLSAGPERSLFALNPTPSSSRVTQLLVKKISLPIQAELRLCSTFFSVSPVTCFRLFVNELSLVRLCLFARHVCRILLRQFRTKERRSRVCSAFAPRLPLTLPPAVHDRMISVHVSAAWHFSFVVCCATFSGERMIPVYVFLTRYRCTVLRNSRLWSIDSSGALDKRVLVTTGRARIPV